MGVAHHTAHLVWFEVGRTEWIRAVATSYREIEETHQLLLPVIELGVRYRRPARYDDLLLVHTWLGELAGATLRFSYRTERGGETVAEGFTVHAFIGSGGRPTRLPRMLREKFEPWIES